MSFLRRPFLLLLLAVCFFSGSAFGQLIQPKLRWEEGDPVVKAILVRLWTYTGRINLLQEKGSENAVYLSQELQKDVAAVSERARLDWTDNYKFTPVYFFVDTAIDAILQQKFTGVLLDKDLKPVENPVLKDGDTAFFIASSDPFLSVFDHRLAPLPPRMPGGIL